ncbi:cell division regulator GpsB [Geomicrobium sp. JCM 19038]|uniref:cell division regulator GpsB n=1 Tax=Geomicrobium sp. JCM 19038 TaxID=1460635 RepID=UPI00045F4D99|nr:cell division regulator GpsB [Geomicrobium sp. JCM 19038]GAK06805.1 cell division protein GpsB [Geomicrobium sp. JCM 19038]
MSVNAQLNAKKILDKEFKTSMKGYNKEEVDQFLDFVIQDYELFQEHVTKLEKEIEQLKKMQSTPQVQRQRSAASQQPERAQTPVETHSATQVGTTNYDILKRLSNLEKEVFGKKLSE